MGRPWGAVRQTVLRQAAPVRKVISKPKGAGKGGGGGSWVFVPHGANISNIKHFSSVAKPSITDIKKNGTAVVAYKTVEDVENAVATLNGSELKGQAIEVDVWVQKPKMEKVKVKDSKELDKHMATGIKPKLTHVYKNTGVCLYETEDEVANACGLMDGTELKGNTLQVDTWTVPERREKKVKVKQQIDD
eukprot:g28020.t1